MGPLDELIGCPNADCENGSVDTGGMYPWGAPIFGMCPRCRGRGVVTRRDYEEECRAMKRAGILKPEDSKSVL